MPTRALQGSAQALQRSISFAMLVAASTSSPSSSAPVAAAAGPLARRASTRPARACATPARRPPARCLPTPPCPPTPRLEATCNPQPTAPCRLSFLTGVVLVVGGHTELHRRLGEPAARKVQDALQLLQGRKRRQQLATLVGSSRRQANQAWVKGDSSGQAGRHMPCGAGSGAAVARARRKRCARRVQQCPRRDLGLGPPSPPSPCCRKSN